MSWTKKVHVESSIPSKEGQFAMFIGRWQPLHIGHQALFKGALDEGKNVLICIRDGQVNEKNPFKGLEISDVLRVETFCLNEIVPLKDIANYDHWIIDVQGAEMNVLKGASEYLKFAKTLVVECSTYELYSTQAHFHQIADFLHGFGFIYLYPIPEDSHGDVIFVNTETKI